VRSLFITCEMGSDTPSNKQLPDPVTEEFELHEVRFLGEVLRRARDNANPFEINALNRLIDTLEV
jgi:hypothetical protein